MLYDEREALDSDEGFYEINQMKKNYPLKIVPHENIIRDGWTHIAKHWHRSVEIILIGGSGFKLWVNGICSEASDGELFIINHGEFHSFTDFRGKEHTGCSLLISYTFLKQLNPKIDCVWFEAGKNEEVNNKLKTLILRIKEIYKQEGAWYNLRLRSLAYEIIYLLFTEYMQDKSSDYLRSVKEGEFYKNVINYIDLNYKSGIRLKDIASYFGYNPDYFSKSFKNYIGENFLSYVKKRKLYNARKLLLKTDKSVLEIAQESGFSDSKAFIRDFKQLYKTTPLKYRKENQR